jgi:hypothetical protein
LVYQFQPYGCKAFLYLALFACDGGASAQEPSSHAAEQLSPAARHWITGVNLANPPNLPAIGKWMLSADGTPAHWMGQIYDGKGLREPINVIIIDEVSSSASEANASIVTAAAAAGYAIRLGHSTGYKAYLGGQVYAQTPRGWDDAFSDEPFELSNNHGRFFGPHRAPDSYVTIGAFSREVVDLFRWPGHRYASFNQARDDLAARLDQRSRFKLIGFINLDNSIVGDPEISTGDHDGKAALLKARK